MVEDDDDDNDNDDNDDDDDVQFPSLTILTKTACVKNLGYFHYGCYITNSF